MHAEGARIVVTNAPGAVREVLARSGREWRSVWKGQDATAGCPGILVVRFRETVSTDALRIVLDLTKQTTWFEVDAVEMIGSEAF